MATKKELEETNRLLRENNELRKKEKLILEETLDDSRDFANVLRDQTKELKFQVSERNQIRSIGNSIAKMAQDTYNTTHEELADLKTQKSLLDVQKKLKKDILGLESLKGKVVLEDKKLQKAINDSIEEQIKSAKKLNIELDKQGELVESTNNNGWVKTYGTLEDIAKGIPGLRKLAAPFEASAKAAREAALQNATNKSILKGVSDYSLKTGSGLTKQRLEQLNLTKITGKLTGKDAAAALRKFKGSTKEISVMKAGFKALGPAITAALGPLALIDLAVKALKFIGDLFLAADANTTGIAKNLGISKDNARSIKDEFQSIAADNENVLVTTKALVKAQSELTTALGAGVPSTKEMVENQVFLTENLGIAGDKAANFQLMMRASGQDVNDVVDSTIEIANAQAAANGYLISGQEILREISNTSAEISGYYGFNNKALAQAVLTARKFGLTLMQTQSISKGLLDFESSIGAELEAELLSGKQLYFEKARMLALQGDSAGAAAEVLKQAQDLTEEQRKNPIIMKSMAKAAGLSVEELNKAYLIEKNLKMSREDYNDLLAKGAKLGKQELVERLGLQGASREEIQKTLTAQEKFSKALEKAKDSFAMLVDDGILDSLVDAIVAFTDYLGVDTKHTKKSDEDLAKEIASVSKKELGDIGISDKYYKVQKGIANLNRGAFGMTSDFALASNKGIREARKNVAEIEAKLRANKPENVKVEMQDFTIKAHPKDTLVMAGGTKLGGDNGKTETLLERLISAVEKGGDVYLNGAAVNQELALSSHRQK